MADGKKRKRSIVVKDNACEMEPSPPKPAPNKRNILRDYTEALFYECAISAQYTANIQVLFKIDDIVHRMTEKAFAQDLPGAKEAGSSLLEKTVARWLDAQEPAIQTFFGTHNLRCATLVLLQRNSISCTVEEKVYRCSVDGNKGIEMANAVHILRHPLTYMEKIQRGRQGALLHFETDAAFLLSLSNDFEKEAIDLEEKLKSLRGI